MTRTALRTLLVVVAVAALATPCRASGFLNVQDPPYGAHGDGTTDDTAEIQGAISAAAAGGLGTVFFPPGTYICASRLTIPAGAQGVTLLGSGGSTSGATLPTNLRFTGAGPATFLTAGATDGTNIRNLAITYTNPGFTGVLLSFDSTTNDSIYCVVENCFLGGAGVTSASTLIAMDLASQISVIRCNLSGAAVGIRGRTVHWSNIIRIRDCNFENLPSSAIRNAGQDWVISGNNFIAPPGAPPVAYTQDSGLCGNGVRFDDNWLGDVAFAGAGAWIQFCGNSL